jgi:MFS family permease
MAGVGTGVLMATLDASIVNISLPTMVEALHTRFATIQWVILSYVLVLTSMVLGFARLGDMYSKKKLYSVGLILFTGGSLLCGLSPGVGWLISFRALQGLGAVMMQALGAAIITEIFLASERGRALGFIGGMVSVGLALGPALGGFADRPNWVAIHLSGQCTDRLSSH